MRLLQPGTKIGSYTIGEPLGEGGFGTVFRAQDDAGRTAAVKVFKDPEGGHSAQHLFAEQNEIEALLRLRHPSLVQIYSYGVLEGVGLYLVMELVEGESLDHYLARAGRLDTIEALRITRRLVEALAHCHALNMLHLDLKPSNIIVTDPHVPCLKILDFGLATVTAGFQSEHTRVTAGTVAYLAPEGLVRSKSARPSARMDLYAVGTILYELLSGRLPFHGRTVDEVIDEKLDDRLVPLAEVAPETPPAVAALVGELIERDPARRSTSAAQVAVRLKQLYYETLHGAGGAASAGEQGIDAAQPDGRPRAPVDGPAVLGPDEVPFVGRAAELLRLEELVHAAMRAEPRAAVVIGDAGSGKSRLVAELLRGVEQSGAALVAYGRCRELSALVPYSALREALTQIAIWLQRHRDERSARIRQAVSIATADDTPLLRALVPELCNVIGGAAPAPGGQIGPGGARWVADLMGRVLAAVSGEIPVVLAVEDLHWADEATHGVLDALARDGDGRALLLLGTARPPRGGQLSVMAAPIDGSGELASPNLSSRGVSGGFPPTVEGPVSSSGAAQPWLAWRGVARIDLGPLPAAENRALLDALVRGAGDEVVAALLRWAPLLGAGNPLFDIQVVRNLELEGYLRRNRAGTFELAVRADVAYRAPASVSDVIHRGLAALSPEALHVLGVAALLGQQFLPEDLRALGLFDPGAVDQALSEAAEHCLCVVDGHAGPGLVSFTHDAARELIAASVPIEVRPQHHRAIAQRIQERGGDPGLLAHHLDRAGEPFRAAEAYLAAALLADRLQDPLGASRLLRRALTVLDPLPLDPVRIELRARAAYHLARVDCLLGSTTEPLAVLRNTERALPEGPLVTAALSSALARVHYVRGEFADAVAHSRKALAAVGDDAALRSYGCLPANVLGRALTATGKVGPAIAPLTRGCELAEAAGEYAELCHSLGILCVAQSHAGLFALAEQSVAEAERIARRLGDPARLLGTWFYHAVLGEARFDWELGVRSTTQLLAYAEENGLSGLYLYTGTMYAGRHQFHVGHLYRARVLLLNALNLGRVLGIGMGRGWAEGYLGDVYFVEGRHDEARACYGRAIEAGTAGTGDAYAAGLGLIGRAHVDALGGAPVAEVRGTGREALSAVRTAGNRTALVTTLERWVEALEVLGDVEGASAAAAERAVLVEDLGLQAPTFWPHAPGNPAESQGRPHWAAPRSAARAAAEGIEGTRAMHTSSEVLSSTPIGHAPTVAVEPGATNAPTVALLETLASVEGFVPSFEKIPGPSQPR